MSCSRLHRLTNEIPSFHRPAWSTGILICFSFTCGISAAILIWRGGQKTKRVAEVEKRLRAALAAEAPDGESDGDGTQEGSLHPRVSEAKGPIEKIAVIGSSVESMAIPPRNRTSGYLSS